MCRVVESVGVADPFRRARMKFERSLVKTVPDTVRRRPTPMQSCARGCAKQNAASTSRHTFASQADMARSTSRRATSGEGGNGTGRRDGRSGV